MGDRPHPVEVREQFHVPWMARDALRPRDVRVLERDCVVKDRGESARSGVEKLCEAGALVFREKLCGQHPILWTQALLGGRGSERARRRIPARFDGIGSETLAQARADPRQTRAMTRSCG